MYVVFLCLAFTLGGFIGYRRGHKSGFYSGFETGVRDENNRLHPPEHATDDSLEHLQTPDHIRDAQWVG